MAYFYIEKVFNEIQLKCFGYKKARAQYLVKSYK